MKQIFLAVCLLIISTTFLASEIVFLDHLIYPQSIRVDTSQLYIVEGEKIHIYSLKDYSKLLTFGKKGEGPREFRVHPGTPIVLNVQGEQMVIKCRRRIYYYTKKGEYIREWRNASHSIGAQPLGDGFAGIEYIYENRIKYLTINIYDSKLNRTRLIKKIRDHLPTDKGLAFLSHPKGFMTSFAVYDDKLFVALNKELKIDVFDPKGDKLYSIEKEYQPDKVTDAYKEKVINYYKTDPFHKQFYRSHYDPITFPEHFLAIRDLRVTNGKVYAITYKKKGDKSECFIFDIKGKFIKKSFLPLKEIDLDLYPFDLGNGKIYQLRENEDEDWELHIYDII